MVYIILWSNGNKEIKDLSSMKEVEEYANSNNTEDNLWTSITFKK
jgi:hypothetical protein